MRIGLISVWMRGRTIILIIQRCSDFLKQIGVIWISWFNNTLHNFPMNDYVKKSYHTPAKMACLIFLKVPIKSINTTIKMQFI